MSKLPAEFYKEPYGTVDEAKVAAEIERLHQSVAMAWASGKACQSEIERQAKSIEEAMTQLAWKDDEIERLRSEIRKNELIVRGASRATEEIGLLRGLLREGMEDQISDVASRYVGWPDNEYTKRRILRDSEWAMRVREALGKQR